MSDTLIEPIGLICIAVLRSAHFCFINHMLTNTKQSVHHILSSWGEAVKVEFKPSCSNLKVFSSYLPGTLTKFVTKRTDEL